MYPKHSCDLPKQKGKSAWLDEMRTKFRIGVLTNEMQLLMESVARFDVFSDTRSFRSRV
jgi:hypothetical protein